MCQQAGLSIHHVEPLAKTWCLVLASPSHTPRRRLSALPEPVLSDRRVGDNLSFEEVDLASMPPRIERVAYVGEVRVHASPVGATVSSATDRSAYGGFSLPLVSPRAFRFELQFDDPSSVQEVVVAGLNERRTAVVRWSQRAPSDGLPETLRRVVSESHQGSLRSEGCMPGPIARVAFVVRVAPAASVSFGLNRRAAIPDGPEPRVWQSLRDTSRLASDHRLRDEGRDDQPRDAGGASRSDTHPKDEGGRPDVRGAARGLGTSIISALGHHAGEANRSAQSIVLQKLLPARTSRGRVARRIWRLLRR